MVSCFGHHSGASRSLLVLLGWDPAGWSRNPAGLSFAKQRLKIGLQKQAAFEEMCLGWISNMHMHKRLFFGSCYLKCSPSWKNMVLTIWPCILFKASWSPTWTATINWSPWNLRSSMDFDPPSLGKHGLPSGNLWHSYWKWTFIVDLPIKHCDFP